MKKSFLIGLVLMLYMAVPAVAQTIIADKVVAVVGNSAILYSEVVDYSKQILSQRKKKYCT